MPPIYVSVDHQRLRQAVEASDLGPKAIATALGVSRQYLWELRAGVRSHLEVGKAAQLAALLGVDPRELFALAADVDLAPYVAGSRR